MAGYNPFGSSSEQAPEAFDPRAGYIDGDTGPAGDSPFGGPFAFPGGGDVAMDAEGATPVTWDEFLGAIGFGG